MNEKNAVDVNRDLQAIAMRKFADKFSEGHTEGHTEGLVAGAIAAAGWAISTAIEDFDPSLGCLEFEIRRALFGRASDEDSDIRDIGKS